MSYAYKGEEIYARVGFTSSDLYEVDKHGNFTESMDIVIDNDDKQIVWYETEFTNGEQFETFEDAKADIDRREAEYEED